MATMLATAHLAGLYPDVPPIGSAMPQYAPSWQGLYPRLAPPVPPLFPQWTAVDTIALHAHSRFGFAHTPTVGWEPAWIRGCSPILRLPYMPYMFYHPNPS